MEKETILIVEDSRELRSAFRAILEASGYQVVTAGDGLEALQKMESLAPDLIIAAVNLPVMGGAAFFNNVRRRPSWMAIPFIFLTAGDNHAGVVHARELGAEDHLAKPVSQEELLLAVRTRLMRARQLHMIQLQRSYEDSLTALANAIDRRDRMNRGHVERVTGYAQVLALQMGWADRHLEQLRFGSILHDIGKIHISERILLKKEPLTDEEWTAIRRHPLVGAEMVKDIPYLSPALPIIRHHHERWDGRGYPDGLSGVQIPFMARVVAVADGYDAMTTPQPYQPARQAEKAYREVLACSGKQYDPEIVSAFARAWKEGQIQSVSQAWQSLHPG